MLHGAGRYIMIYLGFTWIVPDQNLPFVIVLDYVWSIVVSIWNPIS